MPSVRRSAVIPAIPIAGAGPGQLPEAGPKDLLLVGWHRDAPALGGSGLSDGPTRTTLRDPQAIHEHRNRLAVVYRAHQFLTCLLYTSDAADEEDSVDL